MTAPEVGQLLSLHQVLQFVWGWEMDQALDAIEAYGGPSSMFADGAGTAAQVEAAHWALGGVWTSGLVPGSVFQVRNPGEFTRWAMGARDAFVNGETSTGPRLALW